MWKPRVLLLLAVSIGCATTLAGCATPTEAEPDSKVTDEIPTVAELTSLVDEFAEQNGVPGGAVLVEGSTGERSLVTFGLARAGTDVEPNHRFAYRSITKSVVGTVILQLHDEGLLDVSDPVSQYVSGVPNGDAISISDLATMRSGLHNYSATVGLGELLMEDPAREPRASELLELSFDEPLGFQAGNSYEYSNTNTLLLGEVIESVTGVSWRASIDERILAPLSLESVAYGFHSAELDATGYEIAATGDAEELPAVAPGWFGAAGGLSGDISDLARWAQALGSGELLEPSTQRFRLNSFADTSDDPMSPIYDEYGFAMGKLDGWVGHTGSGLGFQALAMYEPETRHTVAVLLNGTGEDPDLPAHLFQILLATN